MQGIHQPAGVCHSHNCMQMPHPTQCNMGRQPVLEHHSWQCFNQLSTAPRIPQACMMIWSLVLLTMLFIASAAASEYL